ncbi:MAG TPA: hypothetical protein VJT32_13110 [bacterium]|nr:hypothetical protein [bacterium]
MRKLIAAVIVGLTVGILTTAALACNDAYSTNQPQNDQPMVQQPLPNHGS